MRFALLTGFVFLLATNSPSWSQPLSKSEALRRTGRIFGETPEQLKQRMRMLKSIVQITKLGGFANATTVKLGPRYRGGNTAIPLLMQFPQLQTVEIINPGSSVSEVGISSLRNLKTVRVLQIHGVRLNQGSLAYLSGWRHISQLALVKTGISDSGLRSLGSMTSLTEVRLSEPNIRGPALGHLRRSEKLSALRLDGSGITDSSLEYLKPFRYLRYLSVEDTSVSDESLRKLWKVHPELLIVGSEGGKPARRGEPFGQAIQVAGSANGTTIPPRRPRRP